MNAEERTNGITIWLSAISWRDMLRRNRHFNAADDIRTALVFYGIDVEDYAEGSRYTHKGNLIWDHKYEVKDE